MGLRINKEQAEGVFASALKLARSSKRLPEAWIEKTRRIGRARSKTFTPMLGTALLAKATDRHADAFALREGESHKSYSARSLAKEVLVPCCAAAGVDIRTNGPEPLNNQPFLRADRVSADLNVKKNAREDLEYLCECLRSADFLEYEGALEALAAFLRARVEATAAQSVVALEDGLLPLGELTEAIDEFEAGDPEGGKVGQALVAALFEIAYDDVRTKRINDPSRRWPGDVGAFEGDRLLLSAEVKQRAFTPTEILLFAKQLRQVGTDRGLIAAFRQAQDRLDQDELWRKALDQHEVEVSFCFRPSQVLLMASRFCKRPMREVLGLIPGVVHRRLQELEVSEPRRDEWAGYFRA